MRQWARSMVDLLSNAARRREGWTPLRRNQLYHQIAEEDADYSDGHLIWSQASSEIAASSEGRFEISALVDLDFRASSSVAVEALRDRVVRELDRAGAIQGGGEEAWLHEDKPQPVRRAVVSFDFNPYFSLPPLGAREFGPGFSRAFDSF